MQCAASNAEPSRRAIHADCAIVAFVDNYQHLIASTDEIGSVAPATAHGLAHGGPVHRIGPLFASKP